MSPGWPIPEADQEAAIAEACRRYGLDFRPDTGLFRDVGAAASRQNLWDREAGGELSRRLRRGDVVAVPMLAVAFRTVGDAVRTLELWSRLGVLLIAADLDRPVQELPAVEMAAALGRLEKRTRSERSRVAVALSKQQRLPVNGMPPLGFRWVRRGRSGWELIPDEEERAVMRQLLEWHEAGWSLDKIRQAIWYGWVHCGWEMPFAKRRGKKVTGVHWSRSNIARRIETAKGFRAESQQQDWAAAGEHR